MRRIPELAAVPEAPALPGSPQEELAGAAAVDPRSAVDAAAAQIGDRLREMLVDDPDAASILTPVALARHAARRGVITPQTASSVEGLFVLRNLATDAMGADKARDFLVLADAVLYTLRAKPGE